MSWSFSIYHQIYHVDLKGTSRICNRQNKPHLLYYDEEFIYYLFSLCHYRAVDHILGIGGIRYFILIKFDSLERVCSVWDMVNTQEVSNVYQFQMINNHIQWSLTGNKKHAMYLYL